ncbi:MAG: hypothetical protein KME03_11355 [Aphanocapsa lilacina HA4352-LM1]|jgi:hypothetical protein|nr:hypothetical protein [Aphanocapsa lilacina HA4352-LM1]
MTSKFGDIIKEARNQENQNAVKPESQKASKPEEADSVEGNPYVSLSIKVRLSQRSHWVAEAKRRRTSITADIIEALTKKYGESG